MLSKRFLLIAVTASAALAQSSAPPTARQIIDQIKANVGVPWRAQTVDTIKAGDPDTPVTGIATTMMATYDVLQRAAAQGKNLVITRFHARGRGRMSPIEKPFAQLTVVVKAQEEEAQAEGGE